MTFKLAFFTDLHDADRPPLGRIDDYHQAIQEKMNSILDYCSKQEIHTVLFGGDWFHVKQPNRVSHALIQDNIKTLNIYKDTLEIIAIPGNHDLGPEGLDSLRRQPLGVLEEAGCLRIARHPILLSQNPDVLLLSRPYNAERDADPTYYSPTPEELDVSIGCQVVMLAHGSILGPGDDRPYPYVNVDKIPGIENIDLLFCGHIHEKLGSSIVGTTIFVNPGSVGRTARTQANYVRTPAFHVEEFKGNSLIEGDTVDIPGAKSAFEVFEGKAQDDVTVPSDEIQAFVSRLGEGLRAEQVDIDEVISSLGDVRTGVRQLVKTYLEEAS